MLKRYVGCLFILCLLINVAFAAKVIVGVNAVYKPLEFLDKKGNIVGFNPDLISIILKNEGYEFEFKDMDFDALLPSLDTGAIDIIASTFTITKERAKKVDFTDVTLVGGISIVYNKKNINKASELSDLRGKKLGCESGTTGCDKILKIDPNAIVFNNTIDLLMSLEAGKIDASVSDTIIVADYIKNKKNTDL
ncbi:MAG: transporter substrate-binding domain-containing protein, partial [Rickettsiales bacterium]|nr:transporter substrate-binding domain-containing protein [Rickettsiales bacterium]